MNQEKLREQYICAVISGLVAGKVAQGTNIVFNAENLYTDASIIVNVVLANKEIAEELAKADND